MAKISDNKFYIGDVRIAGASGGPLHGLTAVVKDSYDCAGHTSSNGSPVWYATHPPATQHAAAVQALLDAGAGVVGKNVMDEMAYSLGGDNFHYGTPLNPACPDRLPGGSSSGTAAAVAAGDADFGLGGDTGGSVRVPASFCGVLGIRPTHGRVAMAGDVVLAPSFSTAGWFARDAAVLRRVGAVLLGPSTRSACAGALAPSGAFRRLLVGADAFDLATPATAAALREALALRQAELARLVGPAEEVVVGRVEGGLDSWMAIFRVHQGYEVWEQHGTWVQQHRPSFGPGIRERFEMASKITREEYLESRRRRAAVRAHLLQLLGDDGVLVIPSASSPAPRVDASAEEIEATRQGLLSLTSIAGLGGLPQLSLPLAKVDGCPVGLGLVGPPGSDEALLELAEKLLVVG